MAVTLQPLKETAEFKQAVAEATTAALAEAVPKILAELAQARALVGASTETQDGDARLAGTLAMEIAKLTDPGRQILAPEVIVARAEAGQRLRKLLLETYARVETAFQEGDEKKALALAPHYTLVSKTQLQIGDSGPQVVEPQQRNPHNNRVYPTRVRWLDVPNLAMEPANEPAKAIMTAFLESIGNRQPDIVYPKGANAPPPGGFIEEEYSLTSKGFSVTGLSMAQIASRAHHQAPNAMNRFGLVLDEDGEIAMPNAGGPPYRDIQILGTIAPPARENG